MNADYPDQLRARARRLEAQEAQRRREEALEERRRRQRARQWVSELSNVELAAVRAAGRNESDIPGGARFREPKDVWQEVGVPWGPVESWSHASRLAEAELEQRRSGFIGQQPGEKIDLPALGEVDRTTAVAAALLTLVVLGG